MLLYVVIRKGGAELGRVLVPPALIKAGNQRVYGRAVYQILLPRHLVGSMRLALRARAEAHAGYAVAALYAHAVGGKRPFVYQRPFPLCHCRCIAAALFAVERLVRIRHGLNVRRGFLIYPCGEIAFGFVYLSRPAGAVVHIHADLCIVLFVQALQNLETHNGRQESLTESQTILPSTHVRRNAVSSIPTY